MIGYAKLMPKPFTIAILPDTQIYVQSYPHIFTSQTQWIVDNKNKHNIKFVLHEGDITDDNSELQWVRASESMSVLDGKVPYAIVIGNHDMGPGGQTENRESPLFNKHFPVRKYKPSSTFGGTFEPELMDNSYHLFETDDMGWLVLALEYLPRDHVLEWANDITALHQDRKTILLTHSHLEMPGQLNAINPLKPPGFGIVSSPEGVNDGVNTWNKLARKHAGMSFVFNGHFLGSCRITGIGQPGNQIYQMLANYQHMEEGGGGYLRLIHFNPSQKRVSVRTYSPYLDLYLTDTENEFVIENCDLYS